MPSSRDCANAIRALAMDAVQQANSGHPGMPMGMADIAEVLWRRHIQINPQNPAWHNRDRFVLSNGHGAMLLYSLLHLTGHSLSIDDLKNFRQLHSKTPGHPEFNETPGVETTTGPLGQGLANAVGMALAEKTLSAQYNQPGFDIIDHYTYVFVGDGCLMEGISHEVASLAGTLALSKLIVFFDDNGISIDGDVTGWFTDNTPERFRAYGWNVIDTVDGHDSEAIEAAINAAKSQSEQPTLICCQTQIGYGSPNKANTAAAHGAPLGEAEIALARTALGWHHEPFDIPEDIYQAWSLQEKGQVLEHEWNDLYKAYSKAHPKLAKEYQRRMSGTLPSQLKAEMSELLAHAKKTDSPMATRKASQVCLNRLGKVLPELVGGSADLTGSNCTAWSGSSVITGKDAGGNYIEYGVREFGMAAIMNGLALHDGFLPYGGTFLVFSDYARNAIRLSALMHQRVVYVLTHDSIGLGEDGPTHQPIEHAAMLRLTPGVHVWRPADLAETAHAWRSALDYQGPTCLLLSRQNLPQISSGADGKDIAKGGYVLQDVDSPVGVFVATGSEVQLAIEAAKQLASEGVNIRVVSMPCCERFDAQTAAYRQAVIPPELPCVAIEAGVTAPWQRYVGGNGTVIGIDQFGLSAPAKTVYETLGITATRLVETMRGLLDTINKDSLT